MMDRVKIDPKRRSFTRGGEDFFYLADTLWMAFSKLNLSEWEEILRLRRMQRYNVLQISALPISHDNSSDAAALSPFGPGGFSELNEAYFDRACEMLALAVKYGFTPCIHLLWVNYIPDTWAGNMPTGTPLELKDALNAVEYMARRFKPYAPIYSISGDTRFETERVSETYDRAIDAVRAVDPEALLTLHLAPHADVPDGLCEKIDFYSFQGGHTAGAELENHYRFGLHYFSKPGAKPVVNTEPPYDGHGHGHADGRHGSESLRCAAWQSLLSGASAGVTYGAHGLWSMHRAGQTFSGVGFSNMPFDWRTALRLPGAWEMANARALFEMHGLFGLEPCDRLGEKYPSIRMAASPDFSTLAVYAPFACDVHLTLSLDGYELWLYDLSNMHRLNPEPVTVDGRTTLVMPEVNADLLYIAKKRGGAQ
jgi:hypothetical protein